MSEQDDKKISDIHSLQKMRRELENFQVLARFAPLMRLFGAPGRRWAEPLEKVSELTAQMDRLSTLPDRFNDTFAVRGWIAYEHMNLEVMEDAIALAREGKDDDAERRLEEYYNEDNIQWQLKFLSNIEAFKLRVPLAQKALEDYLAGRFHACVPVILLLIDGFVDDVGKVNQGFFARNVELTAWDSISAHSKGLQKLTQVFCKPRSKTTDEAISVPYRHGILHGHDLGYGNKLVAAKCWAALFSLRDWAIARRDQRGPEPERKVDWRDSIRSLMEAKKRESAINAWRPRPTEDLRGIPRIASATSYMNGSPERSVVEFLEAWKNGNYGRMARSLSGCRADQVGRRAGQMRRELEGRTLDSFAIAGVQDEAAAISVVDVELRIRDTNTSETKTATKSVRVVFEDELRRPKIRNAEAGEWRIVHLDFLW